MSPSNQRPPPDLPGFRYDPVLNRYFAVDRSQPTPALSAPAPPPLQISSTIRHDHVCSFIRSLQYREAGLSSPLACRRCSQIRLMTPNLLRTVSSTNMLPANQAIALCDDIVIAAGTNPMSRHLSELNSVLLNDDDPLDFEPEDEPSVIGAKSPSIFTSLMVRNDYVFYSTL
ncbi:hypothetical protein BVRB_028760, partial [Beta vulgaris subsp. vulgaris]